ncbi:MAG: M23 family metallopeptidase [Planctomycetes bacterium]|nr:M23 family metallopeptidase [Planctomycetota bacterium]
MLSVLLAALGTSLSYSEQANADDFSHQQKLVALPFNKQIEQFEKIANQIVLDGKGDDWQGIPAIADIKGDAGGKPTRDILSVRVAPREDDLLLLIATATAKGDVARRFRIRVDAWLDRTDDFAIDLGEDESAWLSAPGPDGVWKSTTIQGIERKTDQVTEVRIPLKVLEAGLKQLGSAYRRFDRAWVRANVSTLDWRNNTRLMDEAPSCASFWLLSQMLHTEDTRDPVKRVTVEFPLMSIWYVGQGAMGSLSHKNQWAYDFFRTDQSGNYFKPGTDKDANASYLSWNQEVYALVAGRVIDVRADRPDHPPTIILPQQVSDGNRVYIDTGGGVALDASHLQANSAAVSQGEVVRVGSPLGKVGNSGHSTSPHLHMAAWRLPQGTATVPLQLAKVVVGLHNTVDDPWAARMQTWAPQEGFYVRRQ